MLGKVCARFVEKSPIAVLVRGTLERVLGAEPLDAWFPRTAQQQYTRTVLFSTVYDLLSQVVFRIQPSVRAAYRDHADQVGASLISLYNKLHGVETPTSPKAALFGFCLALVAYNMLAVVMAALRSVHGAETIDQTLSLSYVANAIVQTYHGMMMAIPEDAWRVCSRMRPAEIVATLRELAQEVRLAAYRKSPRGPKKRRPKRAGTTKASHPRFKG